MFKNGQLVICINSSGSIHIAQGETYRVSYDSGKEICLQGIPGYYNSYAFKLYEPICKPSIHIDNHVDEQPKTTPFMTLPTDSKERKDYPILNGCIRYFPAALAGVALISKKGNDKHNPGQELHHARSKSMDHGDCIMRHLIDVQDLLSSNNKTEILEEVSQLAWRVLAYSQELHEYFGAPLAPGAKK